MSGYETEKLFVKIIKIIVEHQMEKRLILILMVKFILLFKQTGTVNIPYLRCKQNIAINSELIAANVRFQFQKEVTINLQLFDLVEIIQTPLQVTS